MPTLPDDEAVRPCMRCEALVPQSRSYCPECGSYMGAIVLVVSRPAAAAPREWDRELAGIIEGMMIVLGVIAAGCVLIALTIHL